MASTANISRTKKPSSDEKSRIRRGVANLRKKFKKTKALFLRGKRKKDIDAWIFNPVDLPKFGKEFWFMQFVSTDKNANEQIFLTFGHSEGKVKVNSMTLDSDKPDQLFASVCWAYQDKKISILNKASQFSSDNNHLRLKTADTDISFKGSYPKYSITIKKKGKIISRLNISELKTKQDKYEFYEYFKGIFGSEIINLYMNFEGTLNRKKIKGRALVQKVIYTGPFIPWKWGRLTFNNGSTMEFFNVRLGGRRLNYKINSDLTFSDRKTGKKIHLEGVMVEEIKGTPFWIVQNADKTLKMVLESYSEEDFTFKGLGNFWYREHLVRIIYFNFEINGRVIGLSELGGGIGMLENTSGHMI
jgi:hypothetical protein